MSHGRDARAQENLDRDKSGPKLFAAKLRAMSQERARPRQGTDAASRSRITCASTTPSSCAVGVGPHRLSAIGRHAARPRRRAPRGKTQASKPARARRSPRARRRTWRRGCRPARSARIRGCVRRRRFAERSMLASMMLVAASEQLRRPRRCAVLNVDIDIALSASPRAGLGAETRQHRRAGFPQLGTLGSELRLSVDKLTTESAQSVAYAKRYDEREKAMNN